MNSLSGKIKDITTEGDLSLVKIEVRDIEFKSIVVEKPQTTTYLKIGNQVNILFKETEVIVGHPSTDNISLQNRILCRIIDIKKGKLLSELQLSFDKLLVRAIITSNAVDQLDLQTGKEVLALIKTNEIMLSPVQDK